MHIYMYDCEMGWMLLAINHISSCIYIYIYIEKVLLLLKEEKKKKDKTDFDIY